MTIEPRWRLAMAIVASVAISQVDSLLGLAAMLWAALTALMVRLWREPALTGGALRRLLGVNVFVALVWLVLPWSWEAGGPALHEAGIALATRISLRINAIAIVCAGLLTGLDAFAIAAAAAGLGLPERLSRLLLLTVRYLGVLDDTRRRIDRAMRARGFRARATPRTFAVIAHQVALVLVHAIVRAERVELALKARGWQARALRRDETRAARGDPPGLRGDPRPLRDEAVGD